MANITFSKSSGLNNSVYGQSYEPIKMMIEKKAEAFEKQSILPKIFNMDTSSSFAEKITSMTSMDGFKPVDEGAAFPAESWQEGYSKTLSHVTFKSEFTITEEMLDDAKIINLRKKPTAFITGYLRMRELFGSNLLTGATGESISFRGQTFSTTCNDGLPLFNTAHTSITDAKATQSNMYKNAFSADGLGLVETAMQNYKDDKGNILGVVPDTIVIPNQMSLKKAVFACIGADKDPATSNNGFNYQFGRWNVIVDPYWQPADGTSPWIVLSSQYNEDNIGAVWFDRKPLTLKADEDPATWNMVWRGRARFSAGFNDWRAFAIGGVATGTELK